MRHLRFLYFWAAGVKSSAQGENPFSRWTLRAARWLAPTVSPIALVFLTSIGWVAYVLVNSSIGTEPTWSIRTNHRKGVRVVALCADGRWLATGGDHGVPALWEVGKGEVIKFGAAPSTEVLCLRFSADSSILAAGDENGLVTLWDIPSGKLRTRIKGNELTHSLAFSPEGVMLATGSVTGRVKLWEVASGNLLDTLSGPTGPVHALAFSRDGRMLATGCSGGRLQLWDIIDGKGRERPGVRTQRNAVESVAFSPDGSLLASAAISDGVKVWTVAADRAPSTFPATDHAILDVIFSPDGRSILASSKLGVVDRWDLATGKLQSSLRGYKYAISIAFSQDGRFFCSGGVDAVARVWGLDRSLE
jgi:WD40 repeat protein